MRGFLIGAAALAALELVLQAPSSRIATALALPSRWLSEWMSPAVPLIPDKSGATTTSATTNTATLA